MEEREELFSVQYSLEEIVVSDCDQLWETKGCDELRRKSLSDPDRISPRIISLAETP